MILIGSWRLSASAMRVFVATVPYSRSPDPYKYFMPPQVLPLIFNFSFLPTLGSSPWSLATLHLHALLTLRWRVPS